MTTINLSNSNPGTTTVSTGEQVTFHNDMATSTSLDLPERGGSSCFAPTPTSPVPLSSGADAGPYTISGNATGSYTYTYTTGGPQRSTRSGTISVG